MITSIDNATLKISLKIFRGSILFTFVVNYEMSFNVSVHNFGINFYESLYLLLLSAFDGAGSKAADK